MVDVQQIIPTPEAADFMIGMSSKENEEKAVQDAQKKLHTLRLDFWEATLEQLRGDGSELFDRISPTRSTWLSAGSGIRSCPFQMMFLKKEARVQLSLERANTAESKWIFDQLYIFKNEIEADFGATLIWRRMDEKKQSLIVFSAEFEGYNRDNWGGMANWLSKNIQKLESVLSKRLKVLNIPALTDVGEGSAITI